MTEQKFSKTVWQHFKRHRRDFPWRDTKNPYRIFVSEIMLQQTQAPRVIPKYKEFLREFPTLRKLASSPLSHVLRVWKGLGYNRRAMYLKKSAETVVHIYAGKIPKEKQKLLALPGVGEATAGDILVFAWNMPAVVIETNIRSVFIHFFFPHQEKVSDKEIIPLIEKTLPKKNMREWYYALMDYGSYLKEKENPSRKSLHYAKQSRFKGSNRELRSHILAYILEHSPVPTKKIFSFFPSHPKDLIHRNLKIMAKEGLIEITSKFCRI